MVFEKEVPEELELTYQHFLCFKCFHVSFTFTSYALIDDQLMEVAEKSKVLEFDEHYIGREFAHHCRNVVRNPEDLKGKEWVAAHLHLRNDTSIGKTRNHTMVIKTDIVKIFEIIYNI